MLLLLVLKVRTQDRPDSSIYIPEIQYPCIETTDPEAKSARILPDLGKYQDIQATHQTLAHVDFRNGPQEHQFEHGP